MKKKKKLVWQQIFTEKKKTVELEPLKQAACSYSGGSDICLPECAAQAHGNFN